jgi:hypothetical protein
MHGRAAVRTRNFVRDAGKNFGRQVEHASPHNAFNTVFMVSFIAGFVAMMLQFR